MLTIRLVLAAGWLVHLAWWGRAALRAGAGAAAPGEWRRELFLRLLMLVLIAAALAFPAGGYWMPGAAAPFLAGSFWLGQLLAICARSTLGAAWSIGVRPRAAEVSAGAYAVLPHPIYCGTGLALLAQLLLLQNLPALLLAGGALVVVPVKMRAERRLLERDRS